MLSDADKGGLFTNIFSSPEGLAKSPATLP